MRGRVAGGGTGWIRARTAEVMLGLTSNSAFAIVRSMRMALSWLSILVLGTLLVAACTQPQATPTPTPTPTATPTPTPVPDIKSWSKADISSMLSLAGTVETPGEGAVGPYWNVVRLGVPKQEGVALASRGGNGQKVKASTRRRTAWRRARSFRIVGAGRRTWSRRGLTR